MPPDVPPPALSLLHRQGRLARRRDLVRCGLTRWRLDVLLDTGVLRVVQRDVLSARRDVPDDEAVRAAVVGLDGVASHSTAARVWGIELLESAGWEVTVGRDRSRAAWFGTNVHRRSLADEQVRVVDGLRVTTPVRTVIDLCLALPLPSTDAALREGVDR